MLLNMDTSFFKLSPIKGVCKTVAQLYKLSQKHNVYRIPVTQEYTFNIFKAIQVIKLQ